MHIQAPAVMPKWDYALNKDDEFLMQQWEKRIIEDGLAEAKKRGEWVSIYWDAEKKDVAFGHKMSLEQIGQAGALNANLGNMRKYYAIKYL